MLCIGIQFTYLSAKTSVTIKDTHPSNSAYVILDLHSNILNLFHIRHFSLNEGFIIYFIIPLPSKNSVF